MSKEVMQQALEALEANKFLVNGDDKTGGLAWCMDGYYSGCFNIEQVNKQTNEAITALREALAEQPAQQKPVNLRRGDLLRCIETDELCTVWATSPTGNTLIKWSANNFGNYTAEQIGELFWLEPAQRTWVGLTDEEIWETISRIGTSDSDVNPYAKLADARAIEAKLRSKNEM